MSAGHSRFAGLREERLRAAPARLGRGGFVRQAVLHGPAPGTVRAARGPLRLLVVGNEGIPADGPNSPTLPGPLIYCETVDLPPVYGGHDDDDRCDRRGPRGGWFRRH